MSIIRQFIDRLICQQWDNVALEDRSCKFSSNFIGQPVHEWQYVQIWFACLLFLVFSCWTANFSFVFHLSFIISHCRNALVLLNVVWCHWCLRTLFDRRCYCSWCCLVVCYTNPWIEFALVLYLFQALRVCRVWSTPNNCFWNTYLNIVINTFTKAHILFICAISIILISCWAIFSPLFHTFHSGIRELFFAKHIFFYFSNFHRFHLCESPNYRNSFWMLEVYTI